MDSPSCAMEVHEISTQFFMNLMITGQKLISSSVRTQALAWIRAIFKHACGREKSLSLAFVDDAEIRALNQQWRGKNKPTDVLSFPAHEGEIMPGTEHLLGDIVISVDTAQRQAVELGHSQAEEIVVLFAHGLCHLMGYDHEQGVVEAKRQAIREAELLSVVGIAEKKILTGRA